ncbi:LOW QUALITY PROTEIN: cytokine receptor common subunit beta-like [Eudromia elegans]
MTEFCSLLLSLPFFFSAQAIRESVPMQNLSCYNDYKSQVTCTWVEHSEAHVFLGMTLYRRINYTNPINTFGIGVDDIYSFKPNKTLKTELNVHLYKTVQPLPPQNLSVNLMTSGDLLLTWKGEEGKPAASLSLSNTTRCHLSHEGLVPGSSYVARVRARPGQSSGFSGHFSEWSTEASWETSQGGIQPRNLRCTFNGVDRLMCSWEVKKEIVTSVLFGLFFRTTSASAYVTCLSQCSPVREKTLPHAPYVVQSCEITVTNTSAQSQYHVAVQTKTEEKLIEAYKNIRMLPPANVSVTMRENQEYEMKWIKHTLQYDFIKQRYEVQYWKANQYEKTLQTIDVVNDEPSFIFTLEMLESSTKYRGKMLARVNTADYHGPWSEWSEEFAWETENGRKKKSWEENIPNPSKSLLIQSYLQPSDLLQTDQGLQTVPAGIHGKSGSLQYIILPKEACPQAPQRQAQPGALPLQPSLLPHQREMMQHLSNREGISPAQPTCGKCTHVRPEGQKSAVALSCTDSPQQCSLGYITTDSLLLPSAKDSKHPSLTTDAESASASQEIQSPQDCSCSEFSPGKFGVTVAVSAPPPNPSPDLHLDAFGDYLTVPLDPNEPSESINISLHFA